MKVRLRNETLCFLCKRCLKGHELAFHFCILDIQTDKNRIKADYLTLCVNDFVR